MIMLESVPFNEPDNEGIYPIQHLLQISYTPLSILITYIENMIEFGAKMCQLNNPLVIWR